ncbi:MAG: JmjC domain-containing protein [Candidatus Binatia bacterium]
MDRKRTFNVFRLAESAGPYDELPVLPAEIDPQIHLSRNSRPQPFYLVCEQDTAIVQMSGEAKVEFQECGVRHHVLVPGDWMYVPAGTPHRIVPRAECVQLRFKAREPGWEGAAWYCERCGRELWRDEWDTTALLPQEGYWRACEAFNADAERRLCSTCGRRAEPLDLTGIRWREIAAELRAESR